MHVAAPQGQHPANCLTCVCVAGLHPHASLSWRAGKHFARCLPIPTAPSAVRPRPSVYEFRQQETSTAPRSASLSDFWPASSRCCGGSCRLQLSIRLQLSRDLCMLGPPPGRILHFFLHEDADRSGSTESGACKLSLYLMKVPCPMLGPSAACPEVQMKAGAASEHGMVHHLGLVCGTAAAVVHVDSAWCLASQLAQG